MKKGSRGIVMFLGVLMLLSLACSFGLELPWEAGGQDVQISQEEVSAAATRAAEAAATAAVVANQAGQMAATAVLQGDGVVATAVAQGSELVATAQILPTAAIGAVAGGSTMQQKLANIEPDANGNFTVAITEADLNEFINGSQGGGFQTDTLSADNVQVSITAEHVELSGDVQEPVALPLVIELRPTVVNGQLQFELLSASTGILPVPESMLDLIEAGANSELARALVGLPAGVTVQNATLGDGLLTIFGQQN